jgi:hypothetical protein
MGPGSSRTQLILHQPVGAGPAHGGRAQGEGRGWALGRGKGSGPQAGRGGSARVIAGPGGSAPLGRRARGWRGCAARPVEREEGGWLGRGWAREGGGDVGLVLLSLFYLFPFALLIFSSFCLDSNSSMTHKLNKCTPNKFINRNMCSSM